MLLNTKLFRKYAVLDSSCVLRKMVPLKIFEDDLNFFSSISDGLTDCGDSKCCSHKSCRNSIMCMYLEDPVDVLLRKPPPAVAAPFLKRVQFLFEGEDSVQNYAKQDTFEDR